VDFSSAAIDARLAEILDSDSSTTALTPVTSRLGRLAATQAKAPDQSPNTDAIPTSITGSWGAIARAHMSVKMYANLVKLARAPDGWAGARSRALSAAAILRFLDFWLLVRDEASEPLLTLAPDGSLVAEWFKSVRQRLDVRYSPHGVIFGLITPKNILEGAESAKTVATILKLHPQKPLSWHQAK
jgi:hypothetical protein